MNSSKWLEVTRRNPCRHCHGITWCCRSDDDLFEICRRTNSGSGLQKSDKNGTDYYLYVPSSRGSEVTGQKYLRQPPIVSILKNSQMANPRELNVVYSYLLSELTLLPEHEVQLRNRGLNSEYIQMGQYRSMPKFGREPFLEKISNRFDTNLLLKVPGFYRDTLGKLKIASPPGLIIPVRDLDEQIVALKIRLGDEAMLTNSSRYLWVSSSKRGGCGPGAPVHFPTLKTYSNIKIRITEGELKADVATALSDVFTISIPGVSNWKPILEILKKLKIKNVVLAIDSDASTNRFVANALEKMVFAFRDAGYELGVETWDGACAKGIDDALEKKIPIACYWGTDAFDVVSNIVKAAIGSNPTEEEARLGNAQKVVQEAIAKMHSDTKVVFHPSVLRAVNLVSEKDAALKAEFRKATIKAQVSQRELKSALLKELEVTQSPKYLRPISDLRASSLYEVRDGATFFNKATKDGSVPTRLASFFAKIVQEETIDDGIDEKKVFVIIGGMNKNRVLPEIRVPAEDFSSMNWVTGSWGAKAIIDAGTSKRDHLRAAIQTLSGEIPQRKSFGHTGWRKIEGKWFYFHNNGAIGKDGNSEDFHVDLGNSKIQLYHLNAPINEEDLKICIRKSISFLNVAPQKITYPLLAAVYRSILGEALNIDFSIFLYGTTGLGKSELSSLVQAHFGPQFNGKNLPGNWSSTVNALEYQASVIKDALFTVDDLAPQPTSNETSALLQKVERLLRAQGNQSGRGRLDSNIKQRLERPPRGLILSTGEALPIGASLRGRMLIVELNKGDVDFELLTTLQADAREGYFSRALTAYIQYLAGMMEQLKTGLMGRHQELRKDFFKKGSHQRAPDIAASLTIGMEGFLKFALEKRVIDESERERHLKLFNKALREIMEENSLHQASEDPARRFVELLSAALSGGRAHLVDMYTGFAPTENPMRFGWQMKRLESEYLKGKETMVLGAEYVPRGDRIGWVSSEGIIYLEPDIAYAAAQRLASEQKVHFSTPQQTLWRQLDERGYLITSDKRNKLRIIIEGERRYVLALKAGIIFGEVGSIDPIGSS